MKAVVSLIVACTFFLLNCSGSKRKDDFKTDELLISFNMFVQSGEYENAARLISKTERPLLLKNGSLTDQSIRGMKNLKLSQLRRHEYWLDSDSKLLGIAAVINGTAQKTKISKEQRKVRLNKRANTSIEHKEGDKAPAVQKGKKYIDYNPYKDPKNNNGTAPKKKKKNKAEIKGFVSPDKTTVDIKDTVTEAADEPAPEKKVPTTVPEAEPKTKTAAPAVLPVKKPAPAKKTEPAAQPVKKSAPVK